MRTRAAYSRGVHEEDTAHRTAAGCGAVGAGFAGLFVLPFLGLSFPERPDPTIPDGQPCCTHPDTWAEVWDALPWFATVALLDVFLFTLAAALAYYMAVGARPGPKALLPVPATLLALLAAGVVVSLT